VNRDTGDWRGFESRPKHKDAAAPKEANLWYEPRHLKRADENPSKR